MKKLLFLLLGMAVATASAGVTKSALQTKVAKYNGNKAKIEVKEHQKLMQGNTMYYYYKAQIEL